MHVTWPPFYREHFLSVTGESVHFLYREHFLSVAGESVHLEAIDPMTIMDCYWV